MGKFTLTALRMEDDVEILYNDKKLAFRSADYTIYTRLIEGEYFSYDNLFKRGETQTFIERKTFSGAMARAKMCTEERTPAVFEIVGNSLDISLKDATADYHEKVELQTTIGEELRIGFDSRLVLDAIKAFTCDSISMNFNGPLWPMMLEAEDIDMKVVVLPVRIR
ncbi:MAG: DNA polymerase III subunit beta [Clostridiales bacterium]|nr:DNA polymerase III subunit beta [Clostridiales bacterium]